MTTLYSFDPVVKADCQLLILGSMPGAISLQHQKYYAHPRNAFWPIMNDLFGIDINERYDDRCRKLVDYGVGVWDVLKTCKREGSLDSNIERASAEVNDFIHLYSTHHRLRAVFFNGSAAERLYKKHVLNQEAIHQYNLSYKRLPSTSPAHAAMSFDQKLDMWRLILNDSKEINNKVLDLER